MSRLCRAILATSLLPLVAQAAPRFQVIHSFRGVATDPGYQPGGAIALDVAGNLYGTTFGTGPQPDTGTAYRLSPPAAPNAAWAFTSIFGFKESHVGVFPDGLTAGPDSLFGTTTANRNSNVGPIGCGSVYEMQRHGAVWKAKTLFAPSLFDQGGLCGFTSAVTRGSNGALYGTVGGGAGEIGAIYEVSPPLAGQTAWQAQALYTFQGGQDGIYPSSNLLLGTDGALYGQAVGTNNAVPIYRVAPPAPGQTGWTFSDIYHFAYTDCTFVTDPFVTDANGSIYGTCLQSQVGLPNNNGQVFRLDPPVAGQTAWTKTTLYQFTGGADGGNPNTGLIWGMHGQLYGTTSQGNGGVFELDPPAAGQTAWTERTLWSFGGTDGKTPSSTLVLGHDGTLFGATALGGAHGLGEVFKLHP